MNTSGANRGVAECDEEFLHLGTPPWKPQFEYQPGTHGGPDHEDELQDAGNQHAIGGGVRRRRKVARQQQRRNHSNIQQDGRRGGGPEPLHRVQHRRQLRHDGDANQIGKGNA